MKIPTIIAVLSFTASHRALAQDIALPGPKEIALPAGVPVLNVGQGLQFGGFNQLTNHGPKIQRLPPGVSTDVCLKWATTDPTGEKKYRTCSPDVLETVYVLYDDVGLRFRAALPSQRHIHPLASLSHISSLWG